MTTELWAVAQKGVEVLRHRLDLTAPVGELSILDYYKAPWALAASGHLREAERLLEGVARRAQTGPGQFHENDHAREVLRASTYRNVILLQAAALLSGWGVCSARAIAETRSYQHSEHGGFFGEQDRTTAVEMNTNHTSMAGLFCLQVGQFTNAVAAGEYVLSHLEQQPNLERGFYIHTDTSGVLLTDVDDSNRSWRFLDFRDSETHFWAIGTPVAFLAGLGEYTGDERYLAGADRLLALTDHLADGWESWASAGKVAWGAARMFRATGEERYRAQSKRIAERCLIEQQRPDGEWGPFFLKMGAEGAGYELPRLELTAEFTLLSADIARCLDR
jgi:hypothetical protein